MNLISLKIFLCRNDVKIFVICSLTGGILQVLAKQYLKSHPEFLKDAPITKKKYKQPRFLSPRGGALIAAEISVKFIGQVVINIIAKQGFKVGMITGGAVILKKIPANAISTYLRDSFPQNLPQKKKSLSWLVGKKYI